MTTPAALRAFLRRPLAGALCAGLLPLLAACGGGGAAPVTPQAAPAPGTRVPHYAHVVVVMEENHSYQQIIGNPDAGYENALARGGVNFTHAYAEHHPSQLVTVHQATFVVWAVVTGLHTLGRLVPAMRILTARAAHSGRPPGGIPRGVLLAATLAAACLAAVLLFGPSGPWMSGGLHHGEHPHGHHVALPGR